MAPYLVRALYDYAPAPGEDELALIKGEVVEVVNSDDADWWRRRARGEEGDFPATYVEVLEAESDEVARTAASRAATTARATRSP